jgi:cytochrome P450
MTIQSHRASIFDPLDPEFLEDPYPVYRRLREAGPIVRDGATQWVAARYEAVSLLLNSPELRSEWPESFQQMRIGDGAARDFLLRVILHREGPNHALLRRMLTSTMHVTSGAALRACIARVADEQLDRALETGHLEIMADLALPVPVAIACEMIGIPVADRALVEAWGLRIIKAFTVMLPEAERPSVDDAITQLRDYLLDQYRGPARNETLAAAFGTLAGDGPGQGFSLGELVDNLIFLLVSGFTTTVHALSAAGGGLLTHPHVFSELREDRSLLAGAIEEFLRYDAPIQHVSRFAAAPVAVGGKTIRPGRVVHLLLGSANRDERQFPRPDQLDIRRDPNPHLSFGAGIHMCLGAGLGRLETRVVLERLLERCAFIGPGGDLIRRPIQVFRTWERLPARVGAA